MEKLSCYLKLYEEPLLSDSVPLFWTRPLTRAKTHPVTEMAYPVSEILDHRPVKLHGVDKMELLVCWKGYSVDHDSGELAKNFLPAYNLACMRYCLDKQKAMDIT